MPYISKLAKRLAMSRRSLVLVSALAACVGGDATTEPENGVPGPPAVSSIRMSPESTSVVVGNSMQLIAVPLAEAGEVLSGQSVQWTSSDTMIATVDSTGSVMALAVGAVDIRASIRSIIGRTRITTRPAPVAAISVSPPLSSIQVGQQVALSAVTSSSTGAVLTGRQVSWSSGSGTIASVNEAGVVTGLAEGRATISARSEGRTNVATVDVTGPAAAKLLDLAVTPSSVTLPIGESQFFTVAARWDDNSTTLPSISWSAVGGGTVSSSGMYAPPPNPGVYKVIATHTGGTIRDTATVTVTGAARTLTELTVSPTSANLAPGGVQQFTAGAKWSDGSTALPSLTWSSLDDGTVTVSGRYTAPSAAGTYRVAVAGGTLVDTATVVVAAPPAATVTSFVLSPGSTRVQRGGSVQFSTATTWSDGANRPVMVTYQVTGGTMSTSGLYRAGQVAGTFMVIATCSCGAAADTSGVVIETPEVVGVAISPKATTLQPGASEDFTGTVIWSDNGTDTAPLTFSASGGGSINATTGAYTAPTTTGTYRVILSVSGASVKDTATVTVTTAPPPPPPPPGGFYANRPTNYTNIISNYGFDEPLPETNADQPFGSGGWSMIYGGKITNVSDPTAPVSAPSALQWEFYPGTGGSSVGNVYRTIPMNTDEIYVAFSLWHDSNFEWNTISNKLLYWEDGNIILQSRHNSAYLSLYIGEYDRVYDPNGYRPVMSDFNGKWVNIEYIIKRGNPGLLKVWMNGQLVSNYAVQVPTLSSWSELSINSTWGGGGTRSRTSYRRIDHILVATTP